MKKPDEMDRSIEMRSESLAHRIVTVTLAAWVLFEAVIEPLLFKGGTYNRLPGLLLMLSVCVQRISAMAIRRKMIAGEEENKELSNKAQIFITVFVLVSLIVAVGSIILAGLNLSSKTSGPN